MKAVQIVSILIIFLGHGYGFAKVATVADRMHDIKKISSNKAVRDFINSIGSSSSASQKLSHRIDGIDWDSARVTPNTEPREWKETYNVKSTYYRSSGASTYTYECDTEVIVTKYYRDNSKLLGRLTRVAVAGNACEITKVRSDRDNNERDYGSNYSREPSSPSYEPQPAPQYDDGNDFPF